MRLMIRWSPMSKVFSIEAEGMTRAWPMAPLMSRKTRPTQNHAIISRWIFVPTGTLASGFFFLSALTLSALLSAFTMHHHRRLCGPGSILYCSRRSVQLPIGSGLAYLELYEIGRVNSRITRGTEPALGIGDGLFERRQGKVAERIRAKEFADFFGRI